MAPVTGASKVEKENRVSALISFAEEILHLLSTAGKPKISVTLTDRLEQQLNNFPGNLGSIVAQKYRMIDGKGTELWNLCTRLRRNEDFHKDGNNKIVILMIRILAFYMLDSGQLSGKGMFSNAIRVMKLSLKTAKNCLDLKQNDFALKVLEKSATYENALSKATDVTPEDEVVCQTVSAEYFIVRTLLEWRQGRLEVAEHMFTKSGLPARRLDPNTAENLADLLFEMGAEFYEKKQYEMAVKWLGRAYDIIEGQELDRLSVNANELRVSIIQRSVKALLILRRDDSLEKARNLIALLENDVGDKLVVLLLKLELLSVPSEVFDGSAYATVLQRIIQTVTMSDVNFKLLIHHIRKLNDKSPSIACQVMDEFLQTRIFTAEKHEWVESVMVNRIWMSTSQRDGQDVLSSVESVLQAVAANTNTLVSAAATHACQMLLWARIESNYGLGRYDIAEMWCRLALYPIFKNTGDLNKGKITRKLLLCAIGRQDMVTAREIFSLMPESAKENPTTRFLMYKVAIRSQDKELAAECLAKVHDASSNDATLLYACVMDAHETGNTHMALDALHMLIEKYDHKVETTVHLPALLRVTIRLTKERLESKDTLSDADRDIVSHELCRLFEAASTHAQNQLSGEPTNSLFTMDELDWFSKNSYNLALKYSSIWAPLYILRLIDSCIQFINVYPERVTRQVADDLSLRRTFCNFLATVLLISLARPENNIELQLQYYLAIRAHVESFDGTIQEKLESFDDGPKNDLLKKLSILLPYDFEAACRLKAWDDLKNVILKAYSCQSMKVFELMADCILSCEAPSHVVVSNLKLIVNATWDLEHYNITKLSRYMRCLFQYVLLENDPVAEDLLNQISSLARDASESDIPYPADELEWIATTAFNRAVDFYCTGHDEKCRDWSGKAMNIASFCQDDGNLGNVFQKKLLGLKFDTDR